MAGLVAMAKGDWSALATAQLAAAARARDTGAIALASSQMGGAASRVLL